MDENTILPNESLMALPQVMQALDCSRSHVWALCQKRQFPQPIRLGSRFSRWRSSEVRVWLAAPHKWVDSNLDRTETMVSRSAA